ncbi:MAG: twin-arginine translocase TatA/TatE family subunit [Crocinitomicaceae bacterium]|nr:twin-arginine translocase TatA/TatE family subunit [Crocinitomicaceae bacterium]
MYLFLNDVSGSEVLVILLFILIFFGSKSIPGIARTLGRTMRQVKDATSEIQKEIKKSTDGYQKDLNLEGIFRDTVEEIKQPLDQVAVELDHSIRYNPITKANPLQQIPQQDEPTIENHSSENVVETEVAQDSQTEEESI